jgi:hypothetical protein
MNAMSFSRAMLVKVFSSICFYPNALLTIKNSRSEQVLFKTDSS